MGIKKLTSDLKPYGETVILGHVTTTSIPHFANVVIDGPSMVYHLFHKIQSYKSQLPTWHSFDVLPTYGELGVAVEVFANTLEQQGVKLCATIFDGGLPIDKRSTRLERLEDIRRQLESYKTASPRIYKTRSETHELQRPDIATAIWATSTSPGGSSLPAAPFIVPLAIDLLRSTKYADAVHIVPGEADAFCSIAARKDPSMTAILSADSDMLMYEDAQDTMIIPFSTLTLTAIKDKHGNSAKCISAEGWTPSKIAKRLGLPSLQYVGFYRQMDGSVSTSEILQRSKADPNDSSAVQWESFMKEYMSRPLDLDELNLNNLDPRLAELACQFETLEPDLSDEEQHIYLPPLLEDPSRDASWNYGRDTRQIAYSILALRSPSKNAATSPNHEPIYEHYRSGQRIAKARIPILTAAELEKKLKSLANEDPTDLATTPPWLHFFLHALTQIASAKRSSGKTLDVQSVEHLLGLSAAPLKKSNPQAVPDPGWAKQHLLANVQAVLYSQRMLRQACLHTLRHPHPINVRRYSTEYQPSEFLVKRLAAVADSLAPLSSISQIFLSQSEVSRLAASVDRTYLWIAVRRALAELDIWLPSDTQLSGTPREDGGDVGEGHAEEEGFETVARTKRKRKRKESASRKARSDTRAAPTGNNPFAALDWA